MTDDIERIARGLTKPQRAAVILLPCWGLPAGHNQWPDVQYVNEANQEAVCTGEDMNDILRRELAHAGERDAEGGVHLIDNERECEARWPLDLTPLGLRVRAYLQENPDA